jgi:hypothetical protein
VPLKDHDIFPQMGFLTVSSADMPTRTRLMSKVITSPSASSGTWMIGHSTEKITWVNTFA